MWPRPVGTLELHSFETHSNVPTGRDHLGVPSDKSLG